MKLDKEDIVTAKEMAKTLQQSKNSELIVVGNLLAHLLAEREAPQRDSSATPRTWVGLTYEDIDKAIEDNQRFGGFRKVGFAYDLELVLKEKNT